MLEADAGAAQALHAPLALAGQRAGACEEDRGGLAGSPPDAPELCAAAAAQPPGPSGGAPGRQGCERQAALAGAGGGGREDVLRRATMRTMVVTMKLLWHHAGRSMRALPLLVGVFNPLNAVGARAEDIADEASNFDVFALVGTQSRAPPGAHYRETCMRMTQWLDQVLLTTPHSSLPLILTDLNDGIGIGSLAKDGYVGEAVISESSATKEFTKGAGATIRDVLRRHHMAVYSDNSEPTWFGNKGYVSRIDYIMGPLSWNMLCLGAPHYSGWGGGFSSFDTVTYGTTSQCMRTYYMAEWVRLGLQKTPDGIFAYLEKHMVRIGQDHFSTPHFVDDTYKELRETRTAIEEEINQHWEARRFAQAYRATIRLGNNRLKRLQQAARDRNNSAQFFGALFGTICGQQRGTVNVDGSISVLAHPWAKRVQQDVGSLIRVSDEARALQEFAGPQIVAWRNDPHFRELSPHVGTYLGLLKEDSARSIPLEHSFQHKSQKRYNALDATSQLAVGSSFEITSLATCRFFLIFARPPLWAKTSRMADDGDQELEVEDPAWMKEMGIEQVGWGILRRKRGAAGGQGSDPKKQKAEELLAQARGQAGKGATKSQVLQQIVLILAKLVLSMAGDLRSVISVVLVTAIIPSAAPCIEAAIQAGKNYHKAAMDPKEKAKEDEGVDTAALGSPHLHVWKDFIRALLASTEEGQARTALGTYWTKNVMKYELKDAAAEIKYFRVRVPQGKEAKKKSKRMEGKVRLQWALSTTRIARELDGAIRSEIVRHGGEILIGAAPRGALERDARALLNKLEPEESSTQMG
ncbi:unnamed protein product [Prorocentrum cordatum]|nr:unnamed protein product [Polarella glacialis]